LVLGAPSLRMNIRAQASHDLRQLRRIYLESRRATFGWMDTTTFEIADFDRDTAGEMVLVAEYGGKIRGFSSSWIPDGFIHHLYVDPEFVGSGIGSLLLDTTIGSLSKPVRLKCMCLNRGALRFYAGRGFEVVGEGIGEGGCYYELEYKGDA